MANAGNVTSEQVGEFMMHEQISKELLSALADGELRGSELDMALNCAQGSEGADSWEMYHLIGDVLRSPDLAHRSQHDLLTGLRAQIAAHPLELRPAVLQQVAKPVDVGGVEQALLQPDPAANASVFRWKVAAGFATIAAVAAMSWNLVASVPSGMQLVDAADAPSVVAVASENGEVLRDPRLDALLASHQQYANRPALQLPAEFLRNASLAAGVKPSPQ